MTRILVVAEMALRETARRRSVLAMLLALPLAFHLSRRGDHLGQSIRFVCLGIGWAVATAALFAGRLAAMWILGFALSVPYFLLIRFDQDGVNYAAIAAIMALTVLVAAPLGLTVSAILPRELEGTLVLLVVLGLQMLMDPASTGSRLLPFWFSREIGTYAVDHTDTGYLDRGLVHATICVVVLTGIAGAAAAVRLRRRSHLRPLPV